MAKMIHVGNISTSKLLQDGYYDLRIASAREGQTPSGLLRYTIEFRVVAPESAVNKGHFEDFTFGKKPWEVKKGKNYSDEYLRFLALEDPTAEDPITHQFNPQIKAFKKLMQDMGHPLANASDYDMDEIIESLNIKNVSEQFTVGAFLKSKLGFNGKERTEISFTYVAGKNEPRLQVQASATRSGGRTAQAAQPAARIRTRAAVTPVTTIDVDDDDVQ